MGKDSLVTTRENAQKKEHHQGSYGHPHPKCPVKATQMILLISEGILISKPNLIGPKDQNPMIPLCIIS